MINPFENSYYIHLNKLPSRQSTVHFIVGLITSGRAIAIVAEPRMGKTALLEYIQSPENIDYLYGDNGRKYVFSFINCQMLPHEYSLGQFWEQALSTVGEIVEKAGDNLLSNRYAHCEKTKYASFALSSFFHRFEELGYKLILILDEFDVLIVHPSLGNSEFFGALRGINDFSRGLTTIIATRQTLSQFTRAIRHLEYNKNYGSPFGNIFESVKLRVLSFRDISELLNFPNNQFSQTDKQFISDVSGGHPFILQIAASSLLSLPKRYSNDPIQRYLIAGKKIYESTQLHYQDIWHHWTPHTRKAVVAIALLQTPHMLAIREFHQSAIKDTLPYLAPELGELLGSGIIAEDKNIESGYKIAQGSLLWWLADELLRTIRDEGTFDEWLMEKQVVGGLVSQKELDTLKILAKSVGELLNKGATSLIEAYAAAIVTK